MNALEQAIAQAFESAGENSKANKAYLEFIKANFMVPVDISSSDEEPHVLFFTENEHHFLPVFSNKTALDAWAESIQNEMKLLTLTGVDLLKGIGENVSICLNIGAAHYKEFNPSEIARMKGIVLKLFKTS